MSLRRRSSRRGLARLEYDLDALVLLVAKHRITLRRFVETQAMRNDKAGVDFTLFDQLQQGAKISVHVRLARFDRQRFVHDGAERNLVQKASIDPRNGDCATVAATQNSFAQGSWPI